MRRRVFVAVVAFTVASGFSIFLPKNRHFASSAQEKASASEVKIDNFNFSPATLTVPAGTMVTWTNRDDIPHTVVSTDDPRVFRSKVLDTDEKFSFTFSKPGTYAYFCSVHPKMTGKVIVE
jgi:plastocyanin